MPARGWRLLASAACLCAASQQASALDFGDAPASYGILAADNGARHTVDPLLHIGTAPTDDEADGQPSSNAGGDDNNGTDDEDGVRFGHALMSGSQSYRIPARSIDVTNGTAGDATLHAWIDFDDDGVFEASEYQSATVPAGTTNGNPSADLFWSGLSNLPGGVAYARFRLTVTPLTDNGATAVDERALDDGGPGEVEDYAIAYIEFPEIVYPPNAHVCPLQGTPPIAMMQVWDSAGTSGDIVYGTPYAGDFDGDGRTDLLMSSASNRGGSRDARRFNLYLGPIVGGTTNQPPSHVVDTVWYEWSTTQPWGVADVDADGQAELVLIASNVNSGTADDGFLFAYNLVTGAPGVALGRDGGLQRRG